MDTSSTGGNPTGGNPVTNITSASDRAALPFVVTGKAIKNASDKGLLSFLVRTLSIEKAWKNIHSYVSKSAGVFGVTGRGGSGSGVVGMGQMPSTSPIGGSRLGMAAMGVMAVGGAFMGMTPKTSDAVTQRMSAETFAGISGMSPRKVIMGANQTIGTKGGGATSIGSPTMAAMSAYYRGGYAYGTPTSKGILKSVAGLSAITGGSNEDIAGALASFNGNNALQYGIRLYDNKGNQRPIYTIINELWPRLFKSGAKVSKADVAMVFNPGHPLYSAVMNIANGDPTMFSILANGLIAKASTKASTSQNVLTAKSFSNVNTALDLMGVPKKSIIRAGFKNTTAQNKLLGATEKGLSEGYIGALNTNAALTNGLANMATQVQGVTDGLMRLKGFLDTFPNAGGVSGGISSMVSGAGSFALNAMIYKSLLSGGKGKPIGPVMENGAFTSGSKASGVLGKFGSVGAKAGKFMGRAVPVLGTALSAYEGYKGVKSRKGGFSFSELFNATAIGAGVGAGAGLLATGGVASGPLALLGALTAGGGNLAGQLLGMMNNGGGGIGGGDNLSGSTSGSKTNGMSLQPPVNGPITSGFGNRSAAAKRHPGISANHTGIDYGVPVGTPVHASGDGVVTETGLHRQYGNYVIIKHGRKSTLYAHLSKIMVGTGTRVKGGDVVALSGGAKGASGSGNSTGAHVHFEVRDNGGVGAGGRVNPAGLFGKLFSSFKSAGTAGLNFLKRTGNSIAGSDKFTYKGTLNGVDPFDFSATSNAVGLNNSSIKDLLQSAYLTGRPLSAAQVSAALDGAESDSAIFKAKVPGAANKSNPKGLFNVSATANTKVNPAGGDKGGMAGGSRAGLIKLLYKAGFRGDALETAFAVALAESGGVAARHSDPRLTSDDSYGMFQINMIGNLMSERLHKKWRSADGKRFKLKSADQLYDGLTNAQVAYHMSTHGTNWSAWSTYTNGSFVKFLDDARSAAIKAKIPSYDVGTRRVPEDQLAMVHKDEMILTAAEANKVRNRSSAGGTNNINVQMEVKLVGNSSTLQAQTLLREFKNQLEKDLKANGLGIF